MISNARHESRFVRRWLCAAALIVCCAALVPAIPFNDYRQRVEDTQDALLNTVTLLELEVEDGAVEGDAAEYEDESAEQEVADDADSPEKSLAAVREKLPRTLEVEWKGSVQTVDNGWLHDALDDYEKNSSGTTSERQWMLLNIAKRLQALGERLKEANGNADGNVRDKEAEKGRLAEILRRPEYGADKTKQETALQRFAKQLQDWIRSLLPGMPRIQPGSNSELSTAAQIFIYSLSLLVLAFVVWKAWPVVFRRRGLKVIPRRGARVVLGERLAPDQSAADLLSEAERLARAGDTRGAIRKAYIALLCELGDRKLVRLAQHKTNRDYLRAIRERGALYLEMLPLTIQFEKHWYGAELATEDDWTSFRNRCRQAINLSSQSATA